MALVITLLSMMMMSALGAALVLATTAETSIVTNFRLSVEGEYAADAVLQRAIEDLTSIPDWSPVLAGLTQSTFVDGTPVGRRTLADGSVLDLDRTRNLLNCRAPTACTSAQMSVVTPVRPWGSNNPDWRLFAYGHLTNLIPAQNLPQYVVVFVADDPAENDGDPSRDGVDETNPGAGVVQLRAEAFGPRGAHQMIGATLARVDTPATVRIVSRRLLSQP